MKLLRELTKLNEAKAAPKKFQNTIVSEYGDGVYLIPSSAATLKFDKTETIGGAYLTHVIDEYNAAIDKDDKEELEHSWFNSAPKKALQFLQSHKEVVEISAYDGMSGERSETLLVATGINNVEKIIDYMQNPENFEQEDLEQYAEQLAEKINGHEKELKAWVKKWKSPNKIYTLPVGGKTLVMIAEND